MSGEMGADRASFGEDERTANSASSTGRRGARAGGHAEDCEARTLTATTNMQGLRVQVSLLEFLMGSKFKIGTGVKDWLKKSTWFLESLSVKFASIVGSTFKVSRDLFARLHLNLIFILVVAHSDTCLI
jgi:hypothetical protein